MKKTNLAAINVVDILKKEKTIIIAKTVIFASRNNK